jgi:hypothetical protein
MECMICLIRTVSASMMIVQLQNRYPLSALNDIFASLHGYKIYMLYESTNYS